MKWKAFFIIFKGLSLNQIKQGESPILSILSPYNSIRYSGQDEKLREKNVGNLRKKLQFAMRREIFSTLTQTSLQTKSSGPSSTEIKFYMHMFSPRIKTFLPCVLFSVNFFWL